MVPGITKVQPFDFYDYPFSHSLTMALRWALAVGLIYFLVRRYLRATWVLAALVVSHWVLDFVSHRPDLPLWPGGPKVGLGLWNSWTGSISVEAMIFGLGIWFYLRTTRASDSVGRWAIWSLIALLTLGWLAALFAPPPTTLISWPSALSCSGSLCPGRGGLTLIANRSRICRRDAACRVFQHRFGHAALVGVLHLVLDALGQLLNFLRLLDHVDRQDTRTRLVDILFQFSREAE